MLKIINNQIYICNLFDILNPNLIKFTNIKNGNYVYKNYNKDRYLWYNINENKIKNKYIIFTNNELNILNNNISHDVKLFNVTKQLIKNNDKHNILFYLYEKIDLSKNITFINQIKTKYNIIYNVLMNKKNIGYAIISKKTKNISEILLTFNNINEVIGFGYCLPNNTNYLLKNIIKLNPNDNNNVKSVCYIRYIRKKHIIEEKYLKYIKPVDHEYYFINNNIFNIKNVNEKFITEKEYYNRIDTNNYKSLLKYNNNLNINNVYYSCFYKGLNKYNLCLKQGNYSEYTFMTIDNNNYNNIRYCISNLINIYFIKPAAKHINTNNLYCILTAKIIYMNLIVRISTNINELNESIKAYLKCINELIENNYTITYSQFTKDNYIFILSTLNNVSVDVLNDDEKKINHDEEYLKITVMK